MQKLFLTLITVVLAFQAGATQLHPPQWSPSDHWEVRYWTMGFSQSQASKAYDQAMKYGWENLPLAQKANLWVWYGSKGRYRPDIVPAGIRVWADTSVELERKSYSATMDLVKYRVMAIGKCGNIVWQGEGWFFRPKLPKAPPPPPQAPPLPPRFFSVPLPQHQEQDQEQHQSQTVIVNNYSGSAPGQIGSASYSGGVFGSAGIWNTPTITTITPPTQPGKPGTKPGLPDSPGAPPRGTPPNNPKDPDGFGN